METIIKAKSRVDPQTGCWIWTGRITGKGYGDYNGARAHRISYEEFNGPIPAGMVVMHTCDNPPCVNPSHLIAGTQLDNMRDMRAKGRDNYLLGQEHSRAKLTEDDVRAIRADKRPRKQIGEQYGISSKTVEKIIYRERWKHI